MKKNKVILMGIPHHNNLGDNAIVVAEKKYIEDYFKEYQYYEISEEALENCVDKAKEYINDDDIIFLHGGGNLGDEYLYVEEGRRKVIQLFPNNIIIIFPQTIYFSNTERGKRELEKSKKIYSEHKRLTIVAREKISYEIMKREFSNNNVIFTPDIVTYLNKTKEGNEREGILFILRDDVEKSISKQQVDELTNIAKKYSGKIEFSDTARGKGILEKEREAKLEELFEKYRKAELVITDRLHGMIFAAITSTPCIALDNYNHKVRATFEILKFLDYIKYNDNINEIEEQIKYLLNTKFEKYNNDFAINELKKIKQGGFINWTS